jgi:hypothetical protein
VLTAATYAVEEEIVVSRSVTITVRTVVNQPKLLEMQHIAYRASLETLEMDLFRWYRDTTLKRCRANASW